MEIRRGRILDDGSAFFGPEESPELKGRKEKIISEWTNQDWETIRKLGDQLRAASRDGKGDDIDFMIVSPRTKDFESQLQYRRKGSNDEWNSFIVRNKTEAQISNLEPGTEYEVRIRQRFIEDDGTVGPWSDWSELINIKTKLVEEDSNSNYIGQV